MNDATRAMIVTSMDSLSQVIIALHIRLDALETDNTKFANTVGNLPAILDNLRERQQKLDDRLMALPDDETLEKIKGFIDNDGLVDTVCQSCTFEDKVKDVVSYVDFVEQDDLRGEIADFINNNVSVSLDVSRY
jgi:hypothetical protein